MIPGVLIGLNNINSYVSNPTKQGRVREPPYILDWDDFWCEKMNCNKTPDQYSCTHIYACDEDHLVKQSSKIRIVRYEKIKLKAKFITSNQTHDGNKEKGSCSTVRCVTFDFAIVTLAAIAILQHCRMQGCKIHRREMTS